MTKKQLNENKQENFDYLVANFQQAIESKDLYISKEDIKSLVKKNYDEVRKWTYCEFKMFASDLAANDCDWKQTKHEYDFK